MASIRLPDGPADAARGPTRRARARSRPCGPWRPGIAAILPGTSRGDGNRTGTGWNSSDQLAHLLLEAAEHARLRLADGIGRDPQLQGDLRRQPVLDRHTPERRPGPVLELVLDLPEGPSVQGGDVGRTLGELERDLDLVRRRG